MTKLKKKSAKTTAKITDAVFFLITSWISYDKSFFYINITTL